MACYGVREKTPLIQITGNSKQYPSQATRSEYDRGIFCSSCYWSRTRVRKCGEFHWLCTCVLVHLTESNVCVTEDGSMVEVPRFCTLLPTVQNNILTQVQRQINRIPKHTLESFALAVRNHVFVSPWSRFLLQKLELCFTALSECKSEQAEPVVLSPLSSSTLDKVQSLAARINSPMKIGAPCDYELQKSSWELHKRMTTVRLLSYDDMSPHVANESLEVGELDITVGEECTDLIQGSPLRKRFKKDEEQENDIQGGVLPKPRSTPIEASLHVDRELLATLERMKDRWLCGEACMSKDFEQLLSLNGEQLLQTLEQASVNNLPESALCAVIHNLVSSATDFSYQSSIVLLQSTTLPLLLGLKNCVSRCLFCALSSLLQKFPMAFIDGLLLPLISHITFGPAHSDLLVKLLKDSATPEQRNIFWKKFISMEGNNLEEPFIWNESVVGVAQTLVDGKEAVVLEYTMADSLLKSLERSSLHLNKSSKFAKFVIDLTKKYKQELLPFISALMEMASAHKSMMKATLLRTVKNLA